MKPLNIQHLFNNPKNTAFIQRPQKIQQLWQVPRKIYRFSKFKTPKKYSTALTKSSVLQIQRRLLILKLAKIEDNLQHKVSEISDHSD